MPAKYQAYPEYKDSGHRFVSSIPANWRRCIVGVVSDVIDPQPDHRAPSICDDGEGFPYIGIRDVKKDGTLNFETARPVEEAAVIKQEASFTIEPNNIVFCKVGTLGLPRKIIPHGRCALSATLVLIKVKNTFNSQYVLYALDSNVVKAQTSYLATGSTRAALGIQQIRKFQIPFPSEAEQKQIANFLDHETAKIDTLIEKQQQLIKLLKEKRQAVISHAVTKGLNPDAPMRDSGIEWLGEIPAYWKVKRIKNLASIISKGTTPSTIGGDLVDTGITFLKGENIGKSLSVQKIPEFYISKEVDEQLSRSRLKENDVLVIIAGATTGQASILQKELLPANTNQAVSFIRPKKSNYAKLIVRWLSTEFAQRVIWMGAVQAAQPNLSMEDLGNIPIAVPPANELSNILEDIDTRLEKFDNLIDKANSAIKLIKERRTALISAAVTGKIDVRNMAETSLK